MAVAGVGADPVAVAGAGHGRKESGAHAQHLGLGVVLRLPLPHPLPLPLGPPPAIPTRLPPTLHHFTLYPHQHFLAPCIGQQRPEASSTRMRRLTVDAGNKIARPHPAAQPGQRPARPAGVPFVTAHHMQHAVLLALCIPGRCRPKQALRVHLHLLLRPRVVAATHIRMGRACSV